MLAAQYHGMASRIDHVNIRIPEDGVDEAVAFYRDVLGFEPERLGNYREGERTSFAFRISDTALLHVRPIDGFERPDGTNFDHFCVVVDDLGATRERLAEADVEIEREGEPWGATGRAEAIYVEDPFGYRIELKATT